MDRKVRWGVLSTAKIGTKQVLPAMQDCQFAELVAISSRNLEKAKEEAALLDIPKAYASYEELLADPEIDAIYNPLPNHLHVPWSIKALQAGKHVLCEKPIGLSSEEGKELVEVGKKHPHLKLMEAFMYRHHPQWQQAKNWLAEEKIGKLRTIQCFFSYFNRDAGNIRNKPDYGGGALMDIGCYPISLSRFLFQAEPKRVCGWIENDPDFHVDRLSSAMMDFEEGVASFTCSTQVAPYQRVHIVGTEGRIEIEIPFNAPIDRPCRLWLQIGVDITEFAMKICNQYTIQADLFSQAILEDEPVPTPIEDAIANMEVIEALLKSGKESQWIAI
ncbi:Glucose--fructose oxidoreductase [Planctomycetales bacterium 10988]|nr:Glucose--fructose oxidoreductase [Planctomycetales bacterium 10988]